MYIIPKYFRKVERHKAVSTPAGDPKFFVDRIQIDSRSSFSSAGELPNGNSPMGRSVAAIVNAPDSKRTASVAVDDPALGAVDP